MAARLDIAERGRPLGTPLAVWLNFRMVPFLVAGMSKLWSYTLRVRQVGFEAVEDVVARNERFILSFWHRRLFMMPLAYPLPAEGPRSGDPVQRQQGWGVQRSHLALVRHPRRARNRQR